MDCIVNFPVIIVDDILQEKRTVRDEECCSYSSSNRESWGRCSSLGGNSDGSSSAECTASTTSKHQVLFSFPWPVLFVPQQSVISSILLFQMTLRALATPLRRIQRKSSAKPKNKKKGTVVSKKPKREKLEKGETLSQRLRLCILGRANHRRHRST
ncbi:hypothetical protein BHM03_00025904 [Ensete ventricosum]|nr:hypothetical protein BHM03_00025904 [Ensete ventricosum]